MFLLKVRGGIKLKTEKQKIEEWILDRFGSESAILSNHIYEYVGELSISLSDLAKATGLSVSSIHHSIFPVLEKIGLAWKEGNDKRAKRAAIDWIIARKDKRKWAE